MNTQVAMEQPQKSQAFESHGTSSVSRTVIRTLLDISTCRAVSCKNAHGFNENLLAPVFVLMFLDLFIWGNINTRARICFHWQPLIVTSQKRNSERWQLPSHTPLRFMPPMNTRTTGETSKLRNLRKKK